MRVLVVEDDSKFSRFLCDGLEAEAHQVDVVLDGSTGLERALTGLYDLILLDMILPGLDGFDVLRRIRVADGATPVIAVTARGSVEDRVRGLDLGADDYLVKPFSLEELLARVRAFFRRASILPRCVRIHALTLDRVDRQALLGTAIEELSGREFQLLDFLMQNADQRLTRAMLADRVWGYQFDSETNVIDVYVNYLRVKLGRLGVAPIETLRGVGYRFVADRCRDAADA